MTACSESCPSSWSHLHHRSHSIVAHERTAGSASPINCLPAWKHHKCFFFLCSFLGKKNTIFPEVLTQYCPASKAPGRTHVVPQRVSRTSIKDTSRLQRGKQIHLHTLGKWIKCRKCIKTAPAHTLQRICSKKQRSTPKFSTSYPTTLESSIEDLLPEKGCSFSGPPKHTVIKPGFPRGTIQKHRTHSLRAARVSPPSSLEMPPSC